MKNSYSIRCVFFILFIMLFSCAHKIEKKYPDKLIKADKILISNPNEALDLLISMGNNIKEEQVEVQMYYEILLFRAQDMCYIVHKSRNTIDRTIEFYKNKRDNDNLMAAYYCRGCYFRDNNDYGQATISYQNALSCMSQSKNYSLIGRVYNQLAQVNRFPKESLSLYEESAKYFALAKESATLSYSLRDIATEYQCLSMNDSALVYGLKAYRIALKTGKKDLICTLEGSLAGFYLSLKDFSTARIFIEKNQKCTNDSTTCPLLYMNWGRFYKGTNKLDSAIYYFNKCLKVSNDVDNQYYSFYFLQQIYERLGKADKALYYANKKSDIQNVIEQRIHDGNVNVINAHYNVKRAAKEINKLKASNEYKMYLLYVVSVMVIIMLGVFFSIKKRNDNFKLRMMKIQSELTDNLQNRIGDNNQRLQILEQQLQKSNVENDQFKSEINELELLNEKYQSELNRNIKLENDFMHSNIRMAFFEAAEGNVVITFSQWDDLKAAVDGAYNDYNKRLPSLYPDMSQVEVKVCNLIKAQFSPSEIANLIHRSISTVSSIRSRLYTKITGKKEGAASLDKLLEDF